MARPKKIHADEHEKKPDEVHASEVPEKEVRESETKSHPKFDKFKGENK